MKKYQVVRRVVVAYYYNVEAQNIEELKKTIKDEMLPVSENYQWEDEKGIEIFSEKELKKPYKERTPMACMEI